jgi:hypothetical protein
MYNLYQKFIHYNEYTKKWYSFNRDESILYLNDPKKMESLKEYNSIDDLLKDHKQKTND